MLVIINVTSFITFSLSHILYKMCVTGQLMCLCFAYILFQVDTLLVNPFRAVTQGVGQAVRTMPDNLISNMMMDGLSKVLQYGGVNRLNREESCDSEAIKVGASLDIEVCL